MSAKVRQRNAGDAAAFSVNEKLLRECHTLYNDPDTGKFVYRVKFPNLIYSYVCSYVRYGITEKVYKYFEGPRHTFWFSFWQNVS